MRRLRPPSLRPTEESSTRQPNKAPIGGTAVLGGAVDSSKLTIGSNGGLRPAQFTTTTTGTWLTVSAAVIDVTFPKALFTSIVSAQVKHSAAGATFGLFFAIYDTEAGGGGGATTWFMDNQVVPGADLWTHRGGTGIAYLDVAPIVTPGRRYVALAAKNNTAGTLTVCDGLYDVWGFSLVGY